MTKFRPRWLVYSSLRWLLLAMALVWAAFPTLFMIASSLKQPSEIWGYPPTLFGTVTLRNYAEIGRFNPTFYGNLVNSVLVTVAGVILTLVISLAAAFVFSRFRSGWLRLPALLVITIRMFPPIVVLIPLYPTMSAIGVLDTLTPLVVVGSAFAVSIATLLLKAFVDEIPIDLEESAMIDGCTRLQAYFKITLPLIAPGIAAVVVFVAVGFWNEYMFPLVFTSTEARTVPVTIAVAMANAEGVAWGQLLAMSTIHLVPMVVLVMLVHKHLVRGMTIGAVKG
jgi:multiple sugar transport system permease protein